MLKLLRSVLLVLMTAPLFLVAAGPMETRTGVIESISMQGPVVVIDGYSYRFAIDCKVEIGGSYGAPTLLLPNMKVSFEFENVDASMRVIHVLRELAANASVSQT